MQGDSPAERIRQLRAGRVLALKAATEFVTGTFVTSEEKLSTTTTIITRDGVTTGSRQKVLDETTLARIRGVIQAPPVVGSWKSAEAQLFFYAIGTKLK